MLTWGIIVMNTFRLILSLSYHSKTDRLNQSEGAKKDKVDGKFPVSIPDKTFQIHLQFKTYVLRDLTHIIGIITTSVRPKQTYRIQ